MGRLISLQLKSASDVAARESLHSPVSSAPPIPPKSTARQRHQETETELASSSYCYEEWTMIMDEVKRIYSKRQYKQCSARCIQILEDSKAHVILPTYHRSTSTNTPPVPRKFYSYDLFLVLCCFFYRAYSALFARQFQQEATALPTIASVL